MAAAYRAQGDALLIESQAKMRLADEYDAAQEAKEVGRSGERNDLVRDIDEVRPVARDVFGNREALREARQLRDAENATPGLIRRTVDERVSAGT